MIFSSTLFLFMFLPLTLAGYFLLPRVARNGFLLAVSLLFFVWSQPHYLWLILASIAVNYAGGLACSSLAEGRSRRIALWLAVAANVGLLVYFKYLGFLFDSLNRIAHLSFDVPQIVLPIGISFFTFQGLSYVIDVYRRKVEVQRDPLRLALYIVLFPQLIAGPIVRYIDIAQQIDERHTSLDDLCDGFERFVVGLGKKALIANTMAATADAIWNNGVGQNTIAIAWLGSIAYSLQIYFDFSGYSDMAIGLGRMLGFTFPENFNDPYVSLSITEFWRRWHMTLSTWFRDYVYIPLGGNRRHVYRNLCAVFLLTGIWHGAAWTFVLWGMMHGAFMLAERIARAKYGSGFLDPQEPWRRVVQHIYTLLVVNVGWVLFRAPGIRNAIAYLGTMVGVGLGSQPGFSVWWYLDRWTVCMLVVGVLLSARVPQRIGELLAGRCNETTLLVVRRLATLALFVAAATRVVSGTYNPFIYFQF